MMIESTAGKPGIRMASRFAYAAGAVGLGLLLPWMSLPQLVVFGFGVLVGLPAYLSVPVWFMLLGRHLGTSAG
jgi:hypothetical protein